MALHVVVTDGGKEIEGFSHEARDCGVRALALAADIPYARAHALLKAEGRKDGRGTRPPMMNAALNKGNIPFEYVSRNAFPTLHQTMRRYSTGRYIIMTGNHAMAMIDGVIHDKGAISGLTSRIKHIYRIGTNPVAPSAPAGITQLQINELWDRLNKLEAR